MLRNLKWEGKYGAVNFNHIDCDFESDLKRIEEFRKRCTIEFRCPNGTLDPAIWQNNVNLFAKMLYYSGSTSFDDDTVQKRHEIILTRFADLQYYDEIYLEQALEFCDIVFTNNLDKINFLKQYLKSLNIRKSGDKFPKSPVLTKGKLKK